MVGEIWDEHDIVKEYYNQIGENSFLVKCDADIDDIDTDAESDENDEAKTEPKSAASAKEEMDKALEVENVFLRLLLRQARRRPSALPMPQPVKVCSCLMTGSMAS